MYNSSIRKRLRFKSIERKNRRRKIVKRINNIKKNNLSIKNHVRLNDLTEREKKRTRYYKQNFVTLYANSNFSLFENPENVIDFINKIDKYEKKKNIKFIVFNLDNIVTIDIGSISLLLSKINELSSLKINFVGSLPNNKKAKKFIIDSGFLDKMKNLSTGKGYGRSTKNLIINRGFDRVDNKNTAEEIKKCIEYLTGTPNYYKPIYSVIIEICSNSVEHANEDKSKKNWVVASNYQEDEVAFTVTDIGVGTIKTLQKKKMDTILKSTGIITTVDLLKNAFNKKYESKTLDINRNKGLPRIFSVFNNGYIENLIVISNNVFLDFMNDENSRVLNRNFNGTFYYWVVNKKCIESWQTRS